ncbi:F-box domain, Leucine-rich repeat domain, L domain-like protein [Artemisia annua]|uniref:F-box domain, Leucine-rich repeat domain, L domain-like protein n=1 Tax=Artemisia annua TaxID=35608 RepID=A0A2U1NDK9_ARTAN|nr:F-box domain, Leucine-rich repeat domain, L domain-like protein [Artemisia annua]
MVSDGKKSSNQKSVPKVKMQYPIISCASKSGRKRARNRKPVPKGKESSRNWLDLPSDLAVNILHRVGVIDILENAQKVCTTWRKICQEPVMWRVIHMDASLSSHRRIHLREICKIDVDRSQGQLVDITIIDFCNNDLLEYIADRSSHLRRLEITRLYSIMNVIWTEALKKFPSLEGLSLHKMDIYKEAIATAGRHCPLLKTFKAHQDPPRYPDHFTRNNLPIAIGKYLHELRHLELIGNVMTDIGLEAILDGCRHLESLDLRLCFYVSLKATDLGKRCSRQLKYFKYPENCLDDCPYKAKNDNASKDGQNPNRCRRCALTTTERDYNDGGWTDFYREYYSL